MISMNLHQAAAITGSTLVGKPTQFRGVCTDSRKKCVGQLFIALKGENFNGEDYCQQAIDNGAIAIVVSKAQDINIPQLICKDSLQALSILAKNWAKQCQTTIITITGSNGKTTVKNMVHSILSVSNSCVATQGNLNNEIGVPLTLCAIQKKNKYAVIEMGAAKLGDISWLCSLVSVHTAAITNVSAAHIGRFGSYANIAQEKGEIVANLSSESYAILPQEDTQYQSWKSRTQAKTIGFGNSDKASIKILDSNGLKLAINGQTSQPIQLPVVGAHNLLNAACAAAIVSTLDISIDDIQVGLEHFIPASGRLENLGKINGNTVIDDSYNANPQSAIAAIDVLADFKGKTTLVLGDMAELGYESPLFHKKIGQYAKQNKVSYLFTLGKDSQFASAEYVENSKHFENIEDLSKHIIHHWNALGTLMVKGSRSMHLENLIKQLTNMEKVA